MDPWHKHGTVLVRSDDEKFGVESFEKKLFNVIIIISVGNHTRVFLIQAGIDLFSLDGVWPHFRPCDDTLEKSCFQIFK